MPRDSAGNTSFTSGVPVTGGTNISSAVFNALMADVYAMVQDSLSRSGKGGLLGPLKFADGSAAAPSIAFTEEGASGLHRAGANDHRYSIAGADVLKLLATGAYAAIFGPLTATSAVLKGAVADGASAVGTVLDNSIALANSTAKLASFRNAGVEKAYVDKDGRFVDSRETVAWLASDLALTTAAADVTGLAFPVVSGGLYEFEATYISYTSGTAIGVRPSFADPGGAFSWNIRYVNATSDLKVSLGSIAGTEPGIAESVGASPAVNVARGIFTASATGTVQLQARIHSAGTGTIMAGSRLVARRLA
jgi:hypothetical protein